MARSNLGKRFDQMLGTIESRRGRRARREKVCRVLAVESLESRALLANVVASAVVTSAPSGANFSYTIALSNSSQSTTGIGTFWYAWVPGKDFLATHPISFPAPVGWTDMVTGGASGDGFAIQYVSDSSVYDVQPGNSLNFSFTSADSPASVDGDSVFYPGVPVGTSTVYQDGPFIGADDQFVATAAATLDSIAVTDAHTTVPKGETDQFSAVGTFSNGSTQNLTSQVSWASSATTVASISNVAGSQGIAMGLGQGQATISATLDGITGSTALDVSPAVLESLAVSPSAPFAVIGKTEQFTATGTFSDQTTQNLTSDVTWASSANAVATIANAAGSQGLATGVARGTATISAALDGITGSTVLSVTPALQSITITPANPTLPKGDSEQFTATGVFDDNSTENFTNQVTWASANTGAATISNGAGSNGSAFGLATGTSSITAVFDGITGSTVLTVSPAVLVSISVSPASPSIIENTTDQFSASGLYSDGSTQNLTGLVTWTSGTSSVAAISPAGLATGLAPGASTISAAYLGIAGAAPLSVSPPLVTLTHVDATEKKHKVTKIVLTFSGALEADLASQKGVYTLVIAGKKGLFTAKNAMLVKVSKAQYNAASSPDTVTLTPKTAFALSKQVELTVKGLPPSGLKDALGRLIDGNQDGQPGSNAIAILSKTGVTIEA